MRGLVQKRFFTLAIEKDEYFAFTENNEAVLASLRRSRRNLRTVKSDWFEFIEMPSINGRETISLRDFSSKYLLEARYGIAERYLTLVRRVKELRQDIILKI